MQLRQTILSCILVFASYGAGNTLFLLDGTEIKGEVSAIHTTTVELRTDSTVTAIIPLENITAIKVDDSLTYGPFDQPLLRRAFHFPEALPAPIESESSSVIPAYFSKGYLAYGEILHLSRTAIVTHALPIPSAPSGLASNGVSASRAASPFFFTENVARCFPMEGETPDSCGRSRPIGFFGGHLLHEVDNVPRARAMAAKIRPATLVEYGSLALAPMFLLTATTTKSGPTSIVLYSLTGLALSNSIGWGIYKGYLAQRAVRIYNAELGFATNAELDEMEVFFEKPF